MPRRLALIRASMASRCVSSRSLKRRMSCELNILHPPPAQPNEACALSQLTAFFTSAAILASSVGVNSFSAKATGHIAPSSRFALSLKPNVAYLVLNFCAGWKKQMTLLPLAYAGMPYQVLGERAGALALMTA